ncbi:unnamed protein product, partial [marine sediment metagenome]
MGSGGNINGVCTVHLHLELRNGIIDGPPIGWETLNYYGGKIDGYWIWGYGKNNQYGPEMYNYDGGAVKGNYYWADNFRYWDNGNYIDDVRTAVGENFSCPSHKEDCEDNSIDRNTQFAKVSTGGILNIPILDTNKSSNQIEASNNEWQHGILDSTNQIHYSDDDKAIFIKDISSQT